MKKITISKNPIKPDVFLMIFDFAKHKLLKKHCFFIDFLKIVKSQMSKNAIKPDDLSTFQF